MIDFVPQYDFFNRMAGAIFDMEMRAYSRRVRYYILRVMFIIFLAILITLTWGRSVFSFTGGSNAYNAMRMSLVSRSVVASVAWLEFILLPLLATVMLSNSISREINKRTLEILLSTPITSFQIIVGKLSGGILQILLLIGITLPLIAIIRVFGGVPWDFVIASLCMTLAITVIAAATSLFYSIHSRQPYQVILLTLLTGGFIFGLLPGIAMGLDSSQSWPWLPGAVHVLETINPFIGMSQIATAMVNSDPMGCSVFPWVQQCLLFLGAFAVILLLSILRLRATMLNLAASRGGIKAKAKQVMAFFNKRKRAIAQEPPEEVKGDPILWKEVRSDEVHFFKQKLSTVMLSIVIIIVFICAAFFKVLLDPVFHAVFVTGLTLIAFVRTATLAAHSISKEKQAQTWPILLTTPIEDKTIIKMKAKAILKQTMFYWVIIFGDVLLFSMLLVLNPFSIIGVAVAIIPTVFFFIGMGMYFGMRLKTVTATTAVVYSVPIVLWILCPCIMNFSPLALVAMSVGVGMNADGWAFPLVMTAASVVPGSLYAIAGLLFYSLVPSNMRTYIFNVSGQ